MKPGHAGRRCLDNYPEKRRAALRYACCHRTAQSGERFSGGTAANFFPASPASRCIPTFWQPSATANDFTRSKWSLSAAPFIVTATCHRRCIAIFSALLRRPNSTMPMWRGHFSVGPCQNRHELNVRSHQGRKKGSSVFVMLAISGWCGSEGISARSCGK